MIREARPDDMPALLRMGAAFHAESPWAASLAPFDPESFAAACVHLAGHGYLLVADKGGEVVGMIGAAIVPLYFNAAVPVAQEVFWYAAREHRTGVGVELLRALADRATEGPVPVLLVAAMESLRGAAVAAMFEREGFDPVERMYARTLQ